MTKGSVAILHSPLHSPSHSFDKIDQSAAAFLRGGTCVPTLASRQGATTISVDRTSFPEDAMRNLIVAVVILILVVVGVGYYQSWFTVTKEETPRGPDVHIEVDKTKIKKDAKEFKEKATEEVKDLTGKAKEGGKKLGEKAKDLGGKAKDAAKDLGGKIKDATDKPKDKE
jgi:hypothetical protein